MSKFSTPQRMRSAAALTAVVALAFGAAAAPASAATDDGLWYFDKANIGQAHADGWTGEGVTVAILDGAVNTAIPTLKNANIEVREPSFCYTDEGEPAPAVSTALSGPDSAFHGTNVVSLISGTGEGYAGQAGVKGVAPGAKVLYYAISRLDSVVDGGEKISCLEEDGQDLNSGEVNDAMNEAMDAGADIISISSGYSASAIGDAYSRAIREGVVVLGSIANTDELALSINFPAGANGAVGVQAADASGTILSTNGRPNDNASTMVIAPGIDILTQGTRDGSWEDQTLISATSAATAVEAGYMALAIQKWPDATGNQILQNLVRSGNDEGVASFDPEGLTGFGFATATRMLERDPSQYEDANPLLDVRPVNIPSTAELLLEPTPRPDPPRSEGSIDSPDESAPFMGIGIAIGAVVLISVIVLVVLLLVRRSRRAHSLPNGGPTS